MEAARMGRRGARGGGSNRWKALKRRLGCCSSAWAFFDSSPDHWVREEEAAAEGAVASVDVEPAAAEGAGAAGCDDEIRAAVAAAAASPEAMNLAAALAAERQFRAASAHPQHLRDQAGGAEQAEAGDEAWWCCVCMGRRRGAAFIPCGHTLCRVCSREVWLNRGACPLCNRPILDVLDIF